MLKFKAVKWFWMNGDLDDDDDVRRWWRVFLWAWEYIDQEDNNNEGFPYKATKLKTEWLIWKRVSCLNHIVPLLWLLPHSLQTYNALFLATILFSRCPFIVVVNAPLLFWLLCPLDNLCPHHEHSCSLHIIQTFCSSICIHLSSVVHHWRLVSKLAIFLYDTSTFVLLGL